MFDQCRADSSSRIKEQREHPLGQIAFSNRRLQGLANKLTRTGMRRMRFDEYRIARGERRRGVAASNGKRERKIARAEYDHRSKRTQHGTNVGPRQRLALQVGSVNSSRDP